MSEKWLEELEITAIDVEEPMVLIPADSFVKLSKLAKSKARGKAAVVEPPPPPAPEPGRVHHCCPENIESGLVRLIPPPGLEGSNIIGEGRICVKSPVTGEYLPVYCCPFCNKRWN